MILTLLLWSTTSGEEPAPARAPERFDVHRAMRQGEPTACALCHEADNEALQVEAEQTCAGCHYQTEHTGTQAHLREPPVWMREAVQRSGLPLSGDRIVCLTCHDPHPTGTVPHRPARTEPRAVPEDWHAALLGESAVVQGGDMLRLPLADGALCTACHGTGPESTP